MKKTKAKNSKGITLISLIVTIVILMILAGVSIKLVIGDNGIIKKAKDSNIASVASEEKEKIVLAYEAAHLEVKKSNIPTQVFQQEMDNLLGISKAIVTRKAYPEGFDILFNDTNHKYEIVNGIVNEIGENAIPDKSDIFNFDPTTGTILGIKLEHIAKNYNGNYLYYSSPMHNGYSYLYGKGYCMLAEPIETLIVPNQIDGVPVKNIKYIGVANVKRIAIQEGIERIEKIIDLSNGTNLDERENPIEITLSEVIIPSSVTSIGNSAFAYCTSLTDIKIPNSVTSIEDSVFECCTSLTDIKIPNSVTSIGYMAFSCCTSLRNIIIPSSVTSIENNAFVGCTALKTINIQKSRDYIPGSPWGSNAEIVWNYR